MELVVELVHGEPALSVDLPLVFHLLIEDLFTTNFLKIRDRLLLVPTDKKVSILRVLINTEVLLFELADVFR